LVDSEVDHTAAYLDIAVAGREVVVGVAHSGVSTAGVVIVLEWECHCLSCSWLSSCNSSKEGTCYSLQRQSPNHLQSNPSHTMMTSAVGRRVL
jgi:hypothetical protein